MAPHLAVLDQALTDIATGNINRLVVEMPPRHGKSELGSKYFPSWYLGTFPDRNVILTSATDDLALDFSAAARDVLLEHGPELFGVRIRGDRQAAHRWQLEQGGMLRSAGVGGSIMGRGANLLIIDDYCKNVEEALSDTYRRKVHQWYHSTSSTRLTPDGAVVIIATRWHPRDLIGTLLQEAEETGEAWRRIRFPALGDDGAALWENQFSQAWMEKRRAQYYASGYPWMWEALYQQSPPEVLDAEFDPTYFQDVMFSDYPPNIAFRIVTLDPSVGASDRADYSAFAMLSVDEQGTLWVDANLERRDPMRIVHDGIQICQDFRADVLAIEGNGFQSVLGPMFYAEASRQGFVCPVHLVTNTQKKTERIRLLLTPYLAQGKVKFRRGSPGVALLLEQLKGFPSHKHDDGPDALAMGIQMARHVSEFGPNIQEDPDYQVMT